MNEKYGTGRLLLKAQFGTKGLQRQLEIISSNYSCESQGSKNRLRNLQLWHRSLDVTSSYMESFS